MAGADPFEITQIVDSDGRDDKIKGTSDAIDPRRVTEIGDDVADPIPIAGKQPPRVVQHWLRIILQRHPGLRECAQDFFGHNAVATADIKHGNAAVPFQRRGGERLSLSRGRRTPSRWMSRLIHSST